jgi:hypothetical protein
MAPIAGPSRGRTAALCDRCPREHRPCRGADGRTDWRMAIGRQQLHRVLHRSASSTNSHWSLGSTRSRSACRPEWAAAPRPLPARWPPRSAPGKAGSRASGQGLAVHSCFGSHVAMLDRSPDRKATSIKVSANVTAVVDMRPGHPSRHRPPADRGRYSSGASPTRFRRRASRSSNGVVTAQNFDGLGLPDLSSDAGHPGRDHPVRTAALAARARLRCRRCAPADRQRHLRRKRQAASANLPLRLSDA